MFYIDKAFLGSGRHIIFSANRLEMSEVLPQGYIVENGGTGPGTVGSFAKISELNISLASQEIMKTIEECKIPVSQAGLMHLMRPNEFKARLSSYSRLIKELNGAMGEYAQVYSDNIRLLNSCVTPVLDSDTPEEISCDFQTPVRYDTTSTKTGRMSVVSGPNVLVRKQFKEYLRSRYPGGVVAEIDYSALEPRTGLAIAGSELATDRNLYETVGRQLGLHDRNTVKQMLISFLYGASIRTLSSQAGVAEKDLKSHLSKLKGFFSHDKVVNELKEQLKKHGRFKNRFGRIIYPDSTRNGVLYNNYIQSSAVDVALSGFSNLMDWSKTESIRMDTLFFIHDAMIVDIHPDDYDKVKERSANLETNLGMSFPTKIKVLNG